MKKSVKIGISTFVVLGVISSITQNIYKGNASPSKETTVTSEPGSAVSYIETIPSQSPDTTYSQPSTNATDGQIEKPNLDTETVSEPSSETPFIEKYDNEIVVSAKMILDNFVENYEIPNAPQLWTLSDFDEEGAIMAVANITEESTNLTQKAIIVLTPSMKEDRMTGCTPHYVSVGSTVYGNDGYCDEFFSNIENALKNQ